MIPPLPNDLEVLIFRQAEALGFASAEAYLRAVLGTQTEINRPALSAAQFAEVLDELSAGDDLMTLPQGFSREDIYADHD